MTDKYEMAARLALANVDDGEWRRMSAKQQRELFGAYLFGRKEIRVSTEGQGKVEVRWLGAWEGTHSSYVWQTVTLEQAARAVNGDKHGWTL